MTNRQEFGQKDPSIYQIHIQGVLDKSWGDYFGGQVVSTRDEVNQPPETMLRTPAMDQAALVGLVSRLHGLGLRLLLVERICLGENPSSVSHKPQV